MLRVEERNLNGFQLDLTGGEKEKIAQYAEPLGSEPLKTKVDEMATFFGRVLGEEQRFDAESMGVKCSDGEETTVALREEGWVVEDIRDGKQFVATLCFLCWLKSFVSPENPRLIISSLAKGENDLRWRMTRREAVNIKRLKKRIEGGSQELFETVNAFLAAVDGSTCVNSRFRWSDLTLVMDHPGLGRVQYDSDLQTWFAHDLTDRQLVHAIPVICYLSGKH